VITVIDLNICNIASVCKAIEKLGYEYLITNKTEDILMADKLILPGVGTYSAAMIQLNLFELVPAIRQKVIIEKTPILGICLGMQLLTSYGFESGGSEGLNLIKGKVSYHRASESNLSLPHIGWNDVSYSDFKLFEDIPNHSCFYFVHSYEVILEESAIIATCNYGVDFIAAFQKNNIIGVQFHPEKSQFMGLKLLENYCKGIY